MTAIEVKVPKEVINSENEEDFDLFIDKVEREHGSIDKQSLVLKGLFLTVNLIRNGKEKD